MKRYGKVITVRPSKLQEYIELHKSVWPEHVEMLKKCNVRNFS
ncbi:MAG: L-rhamnose mutarotase, partial [Candidatus Helarchaeota archaeon]|nr:L-rhamnose mutarotase [Candidatus Helarchaeota archaeon]